MAEEAKPKPKGNRSGKLIVLMGIVLMFVGGGFFALSLKTRQPGKPEAVKIELAEKETELEEFITNTSNPATYVRAKIAVILRKDFDETLFKANMADVRDAILLIFNATSPDDIISAPKRMDLKRKLANAMNLALKDVDKYAAKYATLRLDPKWESATGPVVKVRFNSIAVQ